MPLNTNSDTIYYVCLPQEPTSLFHYFLFFWKTRDEMKPFDFAMRAAGAAIIKANQGQNN
jgi:hypothetical protein